MPFHYGGWIINIWSVLGKFGVPSYTAYCTTKHGMIGFTRALALKVVGRGITVNTICPGWVDTPFNDAFTRQMGGRDALLHYVKEKIPLGRFASVDEIAEAILFLASDRSSFMTGHALVIDGGECIA